MRKRFALIAFVGLLVGLSGCAGMTNDSNQMDASNSNSLNGAQYENQINVYEHETEAGNTIHTIEIPPEAVNDEVEGDLNGVVVIPEQDRVCQSFDDKTHEAENAGCFTDGDKVDSYLNQAGIEQTNNDYVVE